MEIGLFQVYNENKLVSFVYLWQFRKFRLYLRSFKNIYIYNFPWSFFSKFRTSEKWLSQEIRQIWLTQLIMCLYNTLLLSVLCATDRAKNMRYKNNLSCQISNAIIKLNKIWTKKPNERKSFIESVTYLSRIANNYSLLTDLHPPPPATWREGTLM